MRDQHLPEPELAEHVHHGLHGGLVRHRDGCHVQDNVQHERRRRGRGRGEAVPGEYCQGLGGHAVDCAPAVRWNW